MHTGHQGRGRLCLLLEPWRSFRGHLPANSRVPIHCDWLQCLPPRSELSSQAVTRAPWEGMNLPTEAEALLHGCGTACCKCHRARNVLRSLSTTKLLPHLGCNADSSLPASVVLTAGAGQEEPHHSNKTSKSIRKYSPTHQHQTKTLSNFHENPKALPNGLPWHETSWGVGRRTKVFSSAGRGGTWLEVPQTPAERSNSQARAFVWPVPLQLSTV